MHYLKEFCQTVFASTLLAVFVMVPVWAMDTGSSDWRLSLVLFAVLCLTPAAAVLAYKCTVLCLWAICPKRWRVALFMERHPYLHHKQPESGTVDFEPLRPRRPPTLDGTRQQHDRPPLPSRQ
jgi:hypothetical protein